MIRFDATGSRPVDKWTTRKPEFPTSPQAQPPQQKRSIDLVHKPVNSVCYRQGPRCVRLVAGVKGCVRARGGDGQAVTRTSPQRNVECTGQPSHHAGKSGDGHGRRWYATTVMNVLDRAGVEGMEEAA